MASPYPGPLQVYTRPDTGTPVIGRWDTPS